MRRFWLILLLLGFAQSARATTLTGTVKDPGGNGITGRLIFQLSQQAAVGGSCGGPYVVVPTAQVIFTLTAGAMSNPLGGSVAVVGNDCMSPTMTYYIVTARDAQNNVLFTQNWQITGSTLDVGTIQPVVVPNGQASWGTLYVSNLIVTQNCTGCGTGGSILPNPPGGSPGNLQTNGGANNFGIPSPGSCGTNVSPTGIDVNANPVNCFSPDIASALTSLTPGANISWNASNAPNPRAKVSLGQNSTLNMSNMVAGGTYVVLVIANGFTLSQGTGCTWNGSFSLPGAPLGDLVGWLYDGSNCNVANNTSSGGGGGSGSISGAATMGTGAISSGACASVVSVTATGAVTGAPLVYTPNVDPTGVTGYGPSASGSLYTWGWVTTNTVNFKVCNNGASPVTPSAIVYNWLINGVTNIASGTAAMGTNTITTGSCASAVTVTASGVATTDSIQYTPSTDPTGLSGYMPVSGGGSLYIQPYPTAGNVNFKVCNNSSGSLTEGALTLTWKVQR